MLSRFRKSVPNRERSAFVQRLLEQALPEPNAAVDENDPLYLAALAVEQDEALNRDMAEWERACIGDGLADLREIENGVRILGLS